MSDVAALFVLLAGSIFGTPLAWALLFGVIMLAGRYPWAALGVITALVLVEWRILS